MEKRWRIEFADSKGMTMTSAKEKGVGLQVFAALEQIVKKFLKEKKPEAVEFAGVGASKLKLYDLAVKRIAKVGGFEKPIVNKEKIAGSIQGDYFLIR
jgi:hypothetical protein